MTHDTRPQNWSDYSERIARAVSERPVYTASAMGDPIDACIMCGLIRRQHINESAFCPEWALRAGWGK